MTTSLRLSAYLTTLKASIEHHPAVWISCQIRAINSKSGHYYLELADDDGTGQVVATIKGTLWRGLAARVLAKFQNTTQMSLSTGLSVRLYGQAKLHTQYGLAFHINDIDPAYTVGRLMQDYQKAKQKLFDEGLLTLNKTRPLPFDLRHIAVIAPEQAAGLGDFQNQTNKLLGVCTFDYHHATFQGDKAVQSIAAALTKASSTNPDLIVIIRGGGSVGDLAYLNAYELACQIARSPTPVWTGIGHARDTTLLDEVAHTAFDTPSKVAAAIEKKLITTWQAGQGYFERLKKHAKRQLVAKESAIQWQIKGFLTLAKATKDRQHHKLITEKNTLKIATHRLNHATSLLREHQTLVLSYHPQKALQRGYAIVYANGQSIKRRQDINTQELLIGFADGCVRVIVPETWRP